MIPAKKAFLFPGHSVKAGMGHGGPGLSPAMAGVYARAEEILGGGITELMRSGPLEELRRTGNSQPATFLASIAVFYDLAALGIAPDVLMGRSLGDFTAVVASGALPLEEGLRLIRRRGDIFERVCRRNPGRMAVILGAPESAVRPICARAAAATNGVCEIAGINTDSNFVISGTAPAVAAAERGAKDIGAHIMDIAMPGPFHSSLMREAGLEFSSVLEKVEFLDPRYPIVYDRAEGGVITRRGELREFLTEQIPRMVDWRRKTGILRSLGVSVICELGPSQGMARITSNEIQGSAYREIETHMDAAAFAGAMARQL